MQRPGNARRLSMAWREQCWSCNSITRHKERTLQSAAARTDEQGSGAAWAETTWAMTALRDAPRSETCPTRDRFPGPLQAARNDYDRNGGQRECERAYAKDRRF